MKRKLFYVIIITIITISCKDRKETNGGIEVKNIKNKTNEIDKLDIIKEKNDKTNCELAIYFLENYQKKYDNIYSKDYINYDGNFSINFENVEYFIKTAELEKFYTNNFINNIRTNFLKINENLMKYPQNDGLIEGLEGDIVLKTQDIEECLEIIRRGQLSCREISTEKCEVNFNNSHSLIFIFDKGKIESIELGG